MELSPTNIHLLIVIMSVISSISAIVFSLVSGVLSPNLFYFLRQSMSWLNLSRKNSVAKERSELKGRPPAEKPRGVWYIFWFSAILTILGGAIVAWAPYLLPVYIVRIDGENKDILVAYDETGGTIWQKKIDTVINKALLEDLDGDGKKEILLGLGSSGEKPGWMIIYDDRGKLIEESNVWKLPIYYPYGEATDRSSIAEIVILDLKGDGTKYILALVNDAYYYGSRLAIFQFVDRNLSEKATYWNPGLLYRIYVLNPDSSKAKDILILGVNNDLQLLNQFDKRITGNVSVAFLLDGKNISGQAPPWFGDININHGSELWYEFVVPSQTVITDVFFEEINKNRDPQIHIMLSDSCSFYWSRKGELIKTTSGTNCNNESEMVSTRKFLEKLFK